MVAKKKISVKKELERAERELKKLRSKITRLRKKADSEKISDYILKDKNGRAVRLSSLFGKKEDLIIIHNMGKSCPYCTLWADGFNGSYKHLENRGGFALVSHDRPAVLKKFAQGRSWRFKYVSNDGGSFSKEMGFQDDKGNPWPGISTFHRDKKNGTIKRVSHASFGPGDDFCSVWHMFDMLKDGPNGWAPKYKY